MEDSDVVDTSDVEEREVLTFSEDILSPSSTLTPLRSVHARVLVSPQSSVTEKYQQRRPSSLSVPRTRSDGLSDHEMDSASPRKRIKLAHNTAPISPDTVHLVAAEVSLLRSENPEVAPLEQILRSPLKCPGELMLAGEEEETSASSTHRDVSLMSDCDSLFSSPRRLAYSSETTRVWSQTLESHSTSQSIPHSPLRSHSAATDHHHLFSSPYHLTTPPPTSSQRSHHQSISARQHLHSIPSSPLTPVSLPPLPQTPSQTPDPIQLLSPRRPQTPLSLVSRATPQPAVPRPDNSPPVEIPEDLQPLNRYSLRRREARQLNPYAWDNLLYKQQLKSHPDAIVKFRNTQRRAGSSGVGQDGTQDEFIFPHDNADEDGDYVEAEARRRDKARSLDRNDGSGVDAQELETEQMSESWLPETLKEISSSDEEDNEIQKLAKRIRRERVKAEAKARAEAKRAAAEARRVEIENRKSVKRRHKPFPVREDADGGAARAPQRSPSSEQSPPNVFSRAHSELTVSPRPTSPARSTIRQPTPSRAPSHSPTPSSRPRSPDFSVYLQDDSYLFNYNDYEEPFPQNHSPVNHSGTQSAPSSPSGPPTTSDASALPSNTSEMESESDQSSVIEMSSKDKKRLRVLKRMMPAAMITRQLRVSNAPPVRPRVPADSSGSEAEEVPAIPGIARIRRGRYKDVEIRGDPESSDIEHPTEGNDDDRKGRASPDAMDFLSDGQSAVMVKRTRHASPKHRHEDDIISLSDNSSPESSSDDSRSGSGDDEQVHQSLFDRPVRGPARERSLIDWMLSRTRNPSRPKSKPKQPTGRRKARGSGPPRLNIVTSGARRYGEHHQTLLSFPRTDTNSSVTPSTRNNSEHRDRTVHLNQDTIEERRKRKKKRGRQAGTNQGSLYNIHHDATRITSKHRDKGGRGKNVLLIEPDDNEFRQALDPGWRAEVERWNKPVSPARRSAANLPKSAPTAPRPRVYRRTSPQPQHEVPLPVHFQHQESPFSALRPVVIDMNITLLPSGVKFTSSSYVGRGLLYQLIAVTSGNSEVARPVSCDMQGLEIGPTTSAAVFSALLGPLCDRLVSALREFTPDNMDTMKEWEPVTRASNQLLSWLAVHAEDEEFTALEATLREYLDGLLIVLDALEANIFTLTAYWFVVELFARLATGVKYRRGSVENGQLVQSAKQLVQRLLGIDLQPAFATFRAAEGDADDTLLPNRAAEMWICLMHLLPSLDTEAPGHFLWRLLIELYPESSPTGSDASEDMWRTIFSLCAISQFSVHGLSTSVFRLPAAWELVAIALKKIILTANNKSDRQLTRRALRKRDEYLSHVVSRCFLLWSQWKWRLDDGIALFKSLQEIFRSRNFANLLHEHSAPMGFFENGDLELLSKRDPHDTVFELFLKLVVQAVRLLNANVELDPKQRSVNIKKLLQMAVPVSPVPFSRSAPPSTHSLSMLVNRFSAMAVAVHLDPTSTNVKFRVSQARRCVNFKDADDQSRVACVYGMMNFAMIVRHHKIAGGLEEVLEWLREMADILMDEYKDGETGAVRKKMTTTLIQLLLGSVRRVVETSSLDKEQIRREYPDPALLNGPWVTRVLNPRTDLVTIQQTGVEIRMLVQSFLNARLKALPEVQPPVVYSVESQESQDEYDKLFLDLNDEELLAALGEEAEASAVADHKLKEDALCNVLDKSITPAVYRLVCKHFGDNEQAKNGTMSAQAADEWIDCWVGCANVLVQNNHKDWGLYMKLGQQSWEKIIDDSWRRRVGLRFNLTLLRLDPRAYSKSKNDFIPVLLVATLSYKTTIEHEFVSVVLSLDGLQHPLLRGAPVDPVPETKKYEINQTDYDAVRERLIETVFSNTAGCLRTRVDAESQAYVEMLVMMLSSMRDMYQELGEERGEYGVFCRRVLDVALGHPELSSHPRLSGVLAWTIG